MKSRRTVSAGIAGLVALVWALGVGLAPAPTVTAASGPKLVYPAKEQLPMRLKGEVFDHEFSVSNGGDQTLTISRITSKCPCAKILEFPKSLEPGESGVIKMRIDAGQIAVALNEKQINIFSNAFPKRQYYYFYIEVRKPYVLKPETPTIAGLFRQEKTSTVSVARASRPFTIVSAKSKQGKFTVGPIETVAKNREYRLPLTAAKADAPASDTDELILEILTQDGRMFTNEVGVKIDHQTPIVLEPSAPLRFLNKDTDPLLAAGAKPIVRKLVVKSVDPETTFEVKSAKIEGKNTEVFSVEVTPVKEGREYALTFTLTEYSKKSYVKGKLVVVPSTGDPLSVEVMAMFGKRR
ncbi:MAG: DUF1573 domain-containing protein [Planctomycetota bacterium]